jgi:ribosomal protein S18 acetylase RimI-like enzyme
MPAVTLVPMTPRDLEAFVDQEVADYADEQILDGIWSRRDALQRSRTELGRVIAREHEALTAERQRLLKATDVNGKPIGWLWVKLGPPGPWSTSAFLCQLTVARPFRHHGFGRSMLAALEALLADEGITDLRLNVYESNLPAKALYAAAGYQLAEQYPTMRQLRKDLHVVPCPSGRACGPAAQGLTACRV